MIEFDPRKMHGTLDFGTNHTGIIQSRLHFTGDEIISEERGPALLTQQCFQDVERLRDQIGKRRPGGHVAGRIPLPLYYAWQREWEHTGKQHGVLWRAFLTGKIMDRDHSKFKVQNI